ncbi:unnamed protein product [Adineta steineri]|uniref:Uncharacterized protein n=1 Tax=Adineta steineri TaxID=433720 RepID=A0A815FSC9_9BILA|nr:unnamed protein product [Adineta steineri]CAF1588125.1 unnamed protein product [Adineta steineri]
MNMSVVENKDPPIVSSLSRLIEGVTNKTIATDARKLIEQLDMKSLQELRLVTKAEKPVEDTLAAIIMISDITWQKDAKRQLANLDRLIEETQLFDKIILTEEHIKYHTVLLKKVRPIHQKYKEIEEDVLEQDQKLILLDNKKATVDKKDQEETVAMKENQLKTASELNQILSRELERTSKIFETSVERQSTLNGTCTIASAFLTYLDSYTYRF